MGNADGEVGFIVGTELGTDEGQLIGMLDGTAVGTEDGAVVG